MTAVAPMGRPQYIPEARETPEEAQERYESIARDAIEAVYDSSEKPLFSGETARFKTLNVLLAVATFESSFRKDVDYGEGKLSRGDGGKSWCLNQLNLGKANAQGKTPTRIEVNIGGGYRFTTKADEGWGGEDLVSDRKKCFHAALAVLRTSFWSCGRSPLQDKLKVYASGSCEKGETESRRRMGLALRWMQRAPVFKDQDVLAWLTPPEVDDENPTPVTVPSDLLVSSLTLRGGALFQIEPRHIRPLHADYIFSNVQPLFKTEPYSF
jgi:hypothetical protein